MNKRLGKEFEKTIDFLQSEILKTSKRLSNRNMDIKELLSLLNGKILKYRELNNEDVIKQLIDICRKHKAFSKLIKINKKIIKLIEDLCILSAKKFLNGRK